MFTLNNECENHLKFIGEGKINIFRSLADKCLGILYILEYWQFF